MQTIRKNKLINDSTDSPDQYTSLHYKSLDTSLSYKLSLFSQLKNLVLNMKNLILLPEWLTELSKLETLTLITPQLEDIQAITQLPSLKNLHIRAINPSSFDNFNIQSLRALSLINLNLKSPPVFISKITDLETLYLNNNQIIDIHSLKECHHLKRLFLTNNQLQSIPDFLFDMNLLTLSLEQNPLHTKK